MHKSCTAETKKRSHFIGKEGIVLWYPENRFSWSILFESFMKAQSLFCVEFLCAILYAV